MLSSILTIAQTESRALFRGRIAIVFFFALPALLSAILGPKVSGLDGPNVEGRTIIGFATLFSFMTVNYVGRALFREYVSHTWRRTAITKPPVLAYLVGKCSAVFALALVQLFAFVLLSISVTDLRFAHGTAVGLAQIWGVLVLHALCGVAVGALMFVFIKRAESFFSATYLALLAFATLGGSIVSSSELPSWSRWFGRFTPHHWTMRAVDEATIGNAEWATVAESAAVLAGVSVALLVVTFWRFDYREEHFADA